MHRRFVSQASGQPFSSVSSLGKSSDFLRISCKQIQQQNGFAVVLVVVVFGLHSQVGGLNSPQCFGYEVFAPRRADFFHLRVSGAERNFLFTSKIVVVISSFILLFQGLRSAASTFSQGGN